MKLATALVTTTAAVAVTLGLAASRLDRDGHRPIASPQTVNVLPGTLTYRLPGEYLSMDKPVDAPLRSINLPNGLAIMKDQVDAADYAQCVAERACDPADGPTASGLPVTGVGFIDAEAYAQWLSMKTGENWRLPTDAEWAFAAAERFSEEALAPNDDGSNPAVRWLARYRKEADATPPETTPQSRGYFGVNANGLADVAGNVWEWTSTCYVRTSDDPDEQQVVENCGVRVAGGRHRAYMSFFVRDGKSGGCAAGIAPQNLGIRLVREKPSMMAWLNRTIARLRG